MDTRTSIAWSLNRGHANSKDYLIALGDLQRLAPVVVTQNNLRSSVRRCLDGIQAVPLGKYLHLISVVNRNLFVVLQLGMIDTSRIGLHFGNAQIHDFTVVADKDKGFFNLGFG
jgi:hypothetical protein